MTFFLLMAQRLGLERLFALAAVGVGFFISIQLTLILAMLVNKWPPANALANTVWPEWQYMVRPEREELIYQVFIVLVMISFFVSVGVVRRVRIDKDRLSKLLCYAGVEAAVTLLLLVCAYKSIVLSQRPQLAQGAFLFLTAVACMIKAFWPQLNLAATAMKQWCFTQDSRQRRWLCAAAGMIVVLIYVPHPDAVLARMFVGEQFHHFDSFMAPVWAHAKGAVLNMDIMTEYGIGLPIAIEYIARLFGGVTYTHVFYAYVWMAIIYFILLLVLVRFWLGSMVIALAAVLLAIKWQMFHPGVTPFAFTFPSATVARYWLDMPFFILLFCHWHYRRNYFVAMAGLIAGSMVFYMTTIGYCLSAAFYAYVAACLILPQLREVFFKKKRQWIWVILWLISVPLAAFVWLWWAQGAALFSDEFWQNMGEFNNYFLSGFGLMPMHESLQNKEVLASLTGFLIPLVYTATIMVLGSLLLFARASGGFVLAVIISVYGLLLYHYYIARSAVTSYDVVAIPYVLVLAFWLHWWLGSRAVRVRRSVLGIILAAVVFAIASNHNYAGYPNMINVSANPIVDPALVQPLSDGRSYFNQLFSRVPENEKLPFNNLGELEEDLRYEKDFASDKALVAYFLKESDFSEDARFIAGLTSSGEAVALLSSFEVKILMQADRKPFFYYSPILIARPMRMRTFPNSTMYTFVHARRMVDQIANQKPRYIFMEKVFLQKGKERLYKDPGLLMMVDFIDKHYTPAGEGQYIAAMKYKG